MRSYVVYFAVVFCIVLVLVAPAFAFRDELIRANLHTHDHPVCNVDWKGLTDHIRSSWSPKVYQRCKSHGLTGVVINPHGISMVNGHTQLKAQDVLDGHLRPYPGLTQMVVRGGFFKPTHWHNEMLWAVQASVDGFVGLRAFEWSGSNHVNVIGSAMWTDFYDFEKGGSVKKGFVNLHNEPIESTPDLPSLCAWLAGNRVSIYGGDVVCQFNHVTNGKATGGWCDFDFAALRENEASRVWPLFSLMQIYSGPVWGPLGSSGVPNVSLPEMVYFKALKAGWQVGPTVGEDNLGDPTVACRTNHTGVWVTSKTQANFLAALRGHRVFATTCRNIRLDFTAETVGGNSCLMGSSIPVAVGEEITIKPEIESDSKIGRVSLMEVRTDQDRPSSMAYADVRGKNVTLDFSVKPSRTTVCYYVKVENGLRMDYTWSAPVFLYHTVSVGRATALSGRNVQKRARPVTTVFLMDCSGSMGSQTPDGRGKLEAAKNAARHYMNLIDFDATDLGANHQVGIVSFASSVVPVLSLTSNISEALQKLDTLAPMDGTNFGDALDISIRWFENLADDRKTGDEARNILIFLSDGMSNTGPVARDEFVVDSVDQFTNPLHLYQRLRKEKISAYTVGFGDSSSFGSIFGSDSGLDEEVLRRIATVPGTGGNYYPASDAFELDKVYIADFHKATGDIVFEETGTLHMRDNKILGPFNPASPARRAVASRPGLWRSFMSFLATPAYADDSGQGQMLITLGWSAGRLGLQLKDPSGQVVDENYPGVHIRRDMQPICVAIDSPKSGNWTATVSAEDAPAEGTRYHFIASARVAPSGFGGGGASGTIDWQTNLLVSSLVGIFILSVLCIGLAIRRRNHSTEPIEDNCVIGWLQVHEPGLPPRNYPVTSSPVRIGRNESNGLVLNDLRASAFHAEIRINGQQVEIVDLGSTNGTSVNGQQIAHAGLTKGDIIGIGDSSIYHLGPEQ